MSDNDTVHPIKDAVTQLVHAIFDIQECEANYLPAVRTSRKTKIEECLQYIELLADKEQHPDTGLSPQKVVHLLQIRNKLHRIRYSNAPTVLQESLFIYLFSSFDAFVGKLLLSLFERKEELFRLLNNTINFQDLLNVNDLISFKQIVLRNEIETIQRKSYTEQFEKFEKLFDIRLRGWKSWANFVEASQRRNLYVHCNGIVSDQYLSICKKAEFKHKEQPVIGQYLALSEDYFAEATGLVLDAGVFLAHTLWRKVLPEELNKADKYLNDLIYDLLQAEKWKDAARIATFRVNQKKSSSDQNFKMAKINLVIAKKFTGQRDFKEILEQEDWSSSQPEFKLARSVLLDDFDEAAYFMKLIGQRGEIITEPDYHSWPLFKEFRLSEKFLDAYNEIYGRPFNSVLAASVGTQLKQLHESQPN